MKSILMHAIGEQSTYLMTSWSHSPAHARDATGSVSQAIHFRQPWVSLNACFLFTQLVANAAVGRIGEVDDIAHLVSYLASKEATFITGELREH